MYGPDSKRCNGSRELQGIIKVTNKTIKIILNVICKIILNVLCDSI